jgi:hypothetical protein
LIRSAKGRVGSTTLNACRGSVFRLH